MKRLASTPPETVIPLPMSLVTTIARSHHRTTSTSPIPHISQCKNLVPPFATNCFPFYGTMSKNINPYVPSQLSSKLVGHELQRSETTTPKWRLLLPGTAFGMIISSMIILQRLLYATHGRHVNLPFLIQLALIFLGSPHFLTSDILGIYRVYADIVGTLANCTFYSVISFVFLMIARKWRQSVVNYDSTTEDGREEVPDKNGT